MLLALSSRTGAGLLGAPHRRLRAGRSSGEYPAELHPVTPHVPTPGESLGQGIDLVVVTPRESEKFGCEIFQPRCALGKSARTTGEQIGLGNQARTLVGFRFICSNVDRTLLKALDKTLADGRVLDQERPHPIACFDLQNLALEVVKTQAPSNDFQNEEHFLSAQQHYARKIVALLFLA